MAVGEICNREVVTAKAGSRRCATCATGRAAHAGSRLGQDLVGILTLDDRLSLLAEETTERAKLVSHERQREAANRA